ncbi:tetratricopeptide repeat protein 25 [Cyclopterus lumpus]|uniref:tetratricopeptide repeat protein 25 n=1 Tax=Cyclopterus lumpus TaxID=8103 RepID=UPI001485E0E6|nr:tetratricopeptide repeat protein 25 [Cyclopterus lumpus]
MSDTDEDHDGQKTTAVFSTMVADGDWLYTKGEYKKALSSYTTALTIKPDDKTCCLGRSKCYLKLGQSESALIDAEASLKKDKSFIEGVYQKAEALYYMGEFEFAQVLCDRGHDLRPQIQGFRLGIQKAQEAIERSLSPSSVKLKIEGDLSFLQKDERAQPIAAIHHLTMKEKPQTQKLSKNEKTTKQLLGEFYTDKKCLETLLKDKDLVKGKMKGGEQLHDVIQGCLTYLESCTKFWTEETPRSARDKERKPRLRDKPCHGAPSEPAQFLLKSLDDIDAELTSGNAEGSLKKAEDVMKMLRGWTEKEVPNQKEVMGSLHSCIGNAFIDLGDMDRALEHHRKDLELATQCKLPDAMSRALYNIGWVYAQARQFTQAIEFWEKKITLARGGLEKTWLFHEIGWCYLELNRHEEARDYGVRSIAAADEIADEKWQINANMLVAQSELKLGHFESCVSHFERALTQATLQDDDSAMNVIQKALDEAKQQLPQ